MVEQVQIFRLDPSSQPPPCALEEELRAQLEAKVVPWLGDVPVSTRLRLTVVVPDNTRPALLDRVLPVLFVSIAEVASRHPQGVDVVVLVATGLHPIPPPQWLDMVRNAIDTGATVRKLSVRLTVHDADETERGPSLVNPLVMPRSAGGWADKVLTVGVVEPHQYAGFSGGSKAISIGCGASSLIASIHSLELLRDPRVLVGSTQDNPFRQRLDQVAQDCGAPHRSVCLVPHPCGEGFRGITVGTDREAFTSAISLAKEALLEPLNQVFDFVILEVPPSKSTSFYQASRAMSYVGLHQSPCIKEGGTLVVRAPCSDGYGTGSGELAFRDALTRGRARLLLELAGSESPPNAYRGGAQRAYVLAMLLERYRCVLVGAVELKEAQRFGIIQHQELGEVGLSGNGLLVEDPFVRLPYWDPDSTRSGVLQAP